MADSANTIEFGFPSWDGESTIHAIIWQPDLADGALPRGIVQLIHGMSEHIERYDSFARFLAGQGFVVCGHDHIGHGHSVSSPEDLGHMPPQNGADVLVEDVDTLRYIASHAFGTELPYFIFGHSMGSFTLRVYLTRHGDGLAGAILCGTGNKPQVISLAGNMLANVTAKIRGDHAKSKLIHNMADGAFSRALENPDTPFDWISADKENVRTYMEDDLNGFPFTLGGYAALTKLTLLAADLELAKSIPSTLPLLFIAGAKDPVGDNGAGVKTAAALMEEAGLEDVEVILYDDMRHEILNESEAHVVFDDVLAWLEAVLSARP